MKRTCLYLSALMLASSSLAFAKDIGQETHAHYRSPGKPGAPVTMSYELSGTPSAGMPLTIRVHFTPHVTEGELKIHYRADPDDLNLVANDASYTLGKDDTSAELTVQAAHDGVYYINVFTELAGRARSFSIPVQVGKVSLKSALKANGKPSVDAQGVRRIRLPAEETVTTSN